MAFLSLLYAGDDCEIRKIGVLPEARRRGIAKQLIEQTTLRNAGRRYLIDVSEKNAGGLAFYRKLGFRELTRRKKYYADGTDAIVMELRMHRQDDRIK